jgi:pantoate kinase
LPKTVKIFVPSGISSFFEICDRTVDEALILDLERIGARGGGFAFEKGVLTEVSAQEADATSIKIFINGQVSPEADTTRTVAETLLEKCDQAYVVAIKHKVEVPIGAGFGSSAAGALGTAFALSKLLGLSLTYNQLGRVAHVAEVKCRTGLGTVSPLLLGGCVITVEPGAPGHSVVDRIPMTNDYRIVTGTFRSIPTKEILAQAEIKRKVNFYGRETMDKILACPSLENFLKASKEFAVKSGFATERVLRLIDLAEKAGAIGAAQNMVGEAVHAITVEDKAESVIQAFKKVLPQRSILHGKIDFQSVRLLS